MKQRILYVGLDVDDPQYYGSALDKDTDEVIDFVCRPTRKGLPVQLNQITKHFPSVLSGSVMKCLILAIPYSEQEQDRNLLRSRQHLLK